MLLMTNFSFCLMFLNVCEIMHLNVSACLKGMSAQNKCWSREIHTSNLQQKTLKTIISINENIFTEKKWKHSGILSNFSFCHIVFKSCLLQINQSVSTSGKWWSLEIRESKPLKSETWFMYWLGIWRYMKKLNHQPCLTQINLSLKSKSCFSLDT